MTDTQQFKAITEDMANIYEKNNDYGSSFNCAIERYGLVAASAQLFHKLNRFDSLVNGIEVMVNDELVIDTLTDLANYAILTRMFIEKRYPKQQ